MLSLEREPLVLLVHRTDFVGGQQDGAANLLVIWRWKKTATSLNSFKRRCRIPSKVPSSVFDQHKIFRNCVFAVDTVMCFPS